MYTNYSVIIVKIRLGDFSIDFSFNGKMWQNNPLSIDEKCKYKNLMRLDFYKNLNQ